MSIGAVNDDRREKSSLRHMYYNKLEDATRQQLAYAMRQQIENGSKLIEAGSREFFSDQLDYQSLWLNLHDGRQLDYEQRAQDETAYSAERVVAPLVEICKRSFPEECQMQGLTILTEDNKIHFCISGFVDVDALQKFYESVKGFPQSQK